jgi:hypothetical protein
VGFRGLFVGSRKTVIGRSEKITLCISGGHFMKDESVCWTKASFQGDAGVDAVAVVTDDEAVAVDD